MENIEGIIFDYGGTIDSHGDHWSHIIDEAYRAENISLTREAFRDAYVWGERLLARVRIVMPEDNFLTLMEKKIEAETGWLVDHSMMSPDVAREVSPRIARRCYESARTAVMEAKPILEALHKAYPMVLVSNFYGNVEAVLEDFGIRHLFDSVIESAVVGVRKPDPQIFALGVETLGMAAEKVLVVGDSLRKDIYPARSIGCQTAWIKGRGWTAEEDAAEDDARIASLESLKVLLDK